MFPLILSGWQVAQIVALVLVFIVVLCAQFYGLGRFEGWLDGLAEAERIRKRWKGTP